MSSATSSPPRKTETIRWRRIVDAADPEKIRSLVRATGVFTAEEVRVAGELAQTTVDGSETYRFLFAERGGEMLGYTCFDRIPLSKVSFDLYWIAVAPSERGTGLAAELMSRTAAFIKSKRGTQVYAETSSKEGYAAARAFYLKSGFTEAARFEDFYEPGDSKIIYRLML
jgi:ribosomal protein S18 acetylase RimI-like enzyme